MDLSTPVENQNKYSCFRNSKAPTTNNTPAVMDPSMKAKSIAAHKAKLRMRRLRARRMIMEGRHPSRQTVVNRSTIIEERDLHLMGMSAEDLPRPYTSRIRPGDASWSSTDEDDEDAIPPPPSVVPLPLLESRRLESVQERPPVPAFREGMSDNLYQHHSENEDNFHSDNSDPNLNNSGVLEQGVGGQQDGSIASEQEDSVGLGDEDLWGPLEDNGNDLPEEDEADKFWLPRPRDLVDGNDAKDKEEIASFLIAMHCQQRVSMRAIDRMHKFYLQRAESLVRLKKRRTANRCVSTMRAKVVRTNPRVKKDVLKLVGQERVHHMDVGVLSRQLLDGDVLRVTARVDLSDVVDFVLSHPKHRHVGHDQRHVSSAVCI